MLASRRRKCRALIILALCGLGLLYVIGTGLLELKNDRLKREVHEEREEREERKEREEHETQRRPERIKDDVSVRPDEPDDIWMKARQELLSNVSGNGVSKVLLYSYMRGGSTVFSHVFNIDPEPEILWYEALDAFHVHYSGLPYYSNPLRLLYYSNQTPRSLDKEKLLAMTKYLEDLLNCRSGRLPLEALTHRFIAVSKALKGFWDCTKALEVSMLRVRKMLPSSACEAIEFDDESDLRIVRCRDVFRFLRRMHKEQMLRGLRGVEIFQGYLDQMEDSELRRSVMGLCGNFWKLQVDSSGIEFLDESEYDLQATVKTAPFHSEHYCETIQNKFAEFFNAAWYMRIFSEQTVCRDVLSSICSKANLVVAGIHRASMSDLELLIQRMPDVHFVFYVRDPRAIAVSRADPLTMQTYINSSNWTAVNESKFLCRRMWDDLEAKKRLKKRYPGSILTVRYEDFIMDPRGTVTRMYNQFQRDVPEGFDRWVNETLNAGTYDGIFGIRRLNSKAHISKWRSKVTFQERGEMNQHCFRVLKHFGYRI